MKKRDLSIITCIYILAFLIGWISCKSIDNLYVKFFIFDIVATIVTFIFSVVFNYSSVYDAYWSLTPMVMSIWLFIVNRAFNIYQILFLIAFNIWSARLTLNWICVFTDFTYEDWRYKHYREISPKLFWPLVNFFGIHMFPTLVVFLGMLPLFSISTVNIGLLSLVGILVLLSGVLLELFADMDMHRFLNDATGLEIDKRRICTVGLWNYSRHPNYLGEILVWFGVYIAMIFYDHSHWYYIIGAVSIAIMFNTISIPLMERRQLSRRPEYCQYMKTTSRLLLIPHK